VLTVALAEAILTGRDYGGLMREYYRSYPRAGYGGMFRSWALDPDAGPYNSFGNGSAMRISPAGFAYGTLEEVMDMTRRLTETTHNHPEGVRGAQATAAAVILARTGSTKEQIRRHITATFAYDLDRTLDEIRPRYRFDVTCQGSVPEAIIAFLESSDYEDAVRNAVSLGGDSDTQACITGGIAEAYYGGVPECIGGAALALLDDRLRSVTLRFMERCVTNRHE
jgi:ADP-ribosylglycohydrolase